VLTILPVTSERADCVDITRGEVPERSNGAVSKFAHASAVPSPSVPARVLFQRLSGRCDPLSSRFVSSCSGAFGSKIGSRANPRFSGAIGKGRGPPFKAVSSPIGRAAI
jgi:hypothetical protein